VSRYLGIAKGLYTWRGRYWLAAYDEAVVFVRREQDVSDPWIMAIGLVYRLITDPSGEERRGREMEMLVSMQPKDLAARYPGSVLASSNEIVGAVLSPHPKRGRVTIQFVNRRSKRFRLARKADPRQIAALLKGALGSRFRDLTEGPISPLSRSF